MQRTQSDHARLDLLSRETNAKHRVGAKAFWPLVGPACRHSLIFGYYSYSTTKRFIARTSRSEKHWQINVLLSLFSYIDATAPNCFTAPCKIILPTKCTAKSISWSSKRPQIQLNNGPSLSLGDIIADTNRYINTQKHRNIYGPHEFAGRGNSRAVHALREKRSSTSPSDALRYL